MIMVFVFANNIQPHRYANKWEGYSGNSAIELRYVLADKDNS